MAKKMRRILAMLLVLTAVFSFGTSAFAAGAEDTVWNGDKMAISVEAGTDAYTFLSLYGGAGGYCNYETSAHVLTEAGAVSLLPMISAEEDYVWQPDGLYELGASNYEVMYCCDYDTPYVDGVYYKRLNLEDSTYYSEEAAAHIRGIVTNVYPFISLEQMKKNLAKEGFPYAEELDRAEVIAAAQAAIWYFANGEEFEYALTVNISQQNWGGVMHDYSSEMSEEIQSFGRYNRKAYEDVGERINALIEHLKGYDQAYAERHGVVISKLSVLDAVPVMEKDGVYTMALRVELNNSGSSKQDDLDITVYVDGEAVSSIPVKLGTETYDLTVEAAAGQSIEAVVSGEQNLPEGVYFYAPESREMSQSLVGIAAGRTSVYARALVELPVEEVPDVTGSLQLQKNGEYGQPLTGAEFALYVMNDRKTLHVGDYEVDADGQLSIDGLLPGEYKLVETEAPRGYSKLNGAVFFEIDENGQLVGGNADGVLTVVNLPELPELPEPEPKLPEPEPKDPEPQPKPPVPEQEIPDEDVPLADVPKTGDMLGLWMAISVLSGTGLAVTAISRRKKADEE